jgi:trafficking protein particle complex subunit 12
LSAAHLAAKILTSPLLDPTDIKTIADLLTVRYSCLELTGNTLLAAQESKALEDLNSEFYYFYPLPARSKTVQPADPLPEHILPFSLRLQASRLQSIGFSDPRRGVSALYDLGLECREHLASPLNNSGDQKLWAKRLTEVGIRVVNALVEMEDLDCAKRTLRTLPPSEDENSRNRMLLLFLRIGNVSAAKAMLEESTESAGMVTALIAMADGRFEDAIEEWETLLARDISSELAPVAQQNLALAFLYAGRLNNARQLLESAISQGEGFASLTFNLATIYELCSEKSRDLKMSLAEKMASRTGSEHKGWEKVNADFKL